MRRWVKWNGNYEIRPWINKHFDTLIRVDLGAAGFEKNKIMHGLKTPLFYKTPLGGGYAKYGKR
jgi:hypothetical protein